MFTGIVESTAIVRDVISNGSNKTFWLESPLASEFKVDQSVSHSGVCLTVEEVNGPLYHVTAIDETLQKTNLANWQAGTLVNLERCLAMNGRLDGHFVQGHVDTVGTCVNRIEKEGSWEFEIQFPEKFAELVIEKGSICMNGTSLTIFNVGVNRFTVAIIPFTFEHTNISQLLPGDIVNLEFDMVGKYINRKLSLSTI
ncbi:riboflavin synthase [Terrimonas alba]|uniref:riboflavin synthase n=1 Tax=Terrimonas alba TaxID=3349636 RepID=UPI0035F28C82